MAQKGWEPGTQKDQTVAEELPSDLEIIFMLVSP